MRKWGLLASVLVCLLVFTCITFAQVTTGTILGTITDSTGAVVPGATVAVRNTETGISRTLTSDAAGRYRAAQLGLGSYEVTAEATGFQTIVRSGITLTVGREAVVDLALQVGAVSERITVTGEAPLIETTNATVSSLMDEKAMKDLPLLGRSFADLTSLQPGVIADLPIGTNVFSGGGTESRRIVGGNKPQQSSYLLDGIEISTPSTGMPVNSVLGEQLGVDAIREFTLLQNNYGAQYGRAGGGVINSVTMSGTNEFHGSLFYFLRNDKLDARDYFLSRSLGKPPLRRNQFGGSVGGPIQKDRTFFFLNYEGVRLNTGLSRIGSVLTPETRRGNITGCPAGRTSCAPGESIIVARVSVDPNIIPVMNLLPLPNGNYRGSGVADLYSAPRWFADENYGMARIDQHFSEKDSLFGRLTADRSSRKDNEEALYPAGHFELQTGAYWVAALSETHIFSPTVLNTFRMGFTRRNDRRFTNYIHGGDQFPDAPGVDPRLALIKGLPTHSYTVPGVNIYGGTGLNTAVWFVDNTFSYDDSLNINRGLHSIAIGGTFKRYRPQLDFLPWVTGWIAWQTIENFLTNKPLNLTMYVGTSKGSLEADNYRGWRQSYGAFFFQDDYQVLPNLSFNLGVRLEWISGPKEVNGKLAVFKDLYRDADLTLLTKDDPLFVVRDALRSFSPRVGFAWTPFEDRKTVFRGGFGIFKQLPLEYEYQVSLDAPPYSRRVNLEQPLLKFPYPFRNAAGQEDIRIAKAGAEPLISPTDLKMPYTMQWTFSLERQLTETMVAKASYNGMRGVTLFGIYNPVQPPTQIKDGRHYNPGGVPTTNPNFLSVRYHVPFASQSYHAGQFVLEKRFSSGLQANASYTWSRNIDNGGGPGTRCAENISGNAITMYNSHDFAADRALSALHVEHNFIASYSYELPFGNGQRWGSQWPASLDYLLSGWAISGTNSWRSGIPINLGMTPRQSRCVGQQCPERPDLIPGGNNNPVRDNWVPESYFDPSQFVVTSLGFYGNVGRNTLIRPGVFSWNLSFAKDFSIREATKLEFRGEFFNILNHPNFGTPGTNVFRTAAGTLDPNVGRITDTSTAMRRIQLGLRLTF